MLDRHPGRVRLLPAVRRDGGHQPLAELLEGAAEPADPPVKVALVGRDREVVPPVTPHLGQEGRLARARQQVAHQRDRQHLGVRADRLRPRGWRDSDRAGLECVVDQHVGVHEQVRWRHHGGGPPEREEAEHSFSARGASYRRVIPHSAPEEPRRDPVI
jgi:hypothetical protein